MFSSNTVPTGFPCDLFPDLIMTGSRKACPPPPNLLPRPRRQKTPKFCLDVPSVFGLVHVRTWDCPVSVGSTMVVAVVRVGVRVPLTVRRLGLDVLWRVDIYVCVTCLWSECTHLISSCLSVRRSVCQWDHSTDVNVMKTAVVVWNSRFFTDGNSVLTNSLPS